MKVYHNINPIYNKNSKILILGSIPSKVSRDKNFYYANKSNRFWKIISIIYEKDFNSNNDKKKFLLKNKIAMWDIIKSCEIKGSSDASIKNIELNDIKSIINNSKIKCIFCTGLKSYTLLTKNFKINMPIRYLPSPSSANASKKIDELINEYKIIKKYL